MFFFFKHKTAYEIRISDWISDVCSSDLGTGFVLDNIITPGELLSFYAIIGYFTGPVSGLIGMNKTARDAMIAADRLFEIMDVEREGTENKTELTPPMIGDIRFKKVSFRYGSRVTVFEDFDLCIPAGKITAVVGESGSGKTTLLSLQIGRAHV